MVEVVFEDSAAGSPAAGVGRTVQSGGGGNCALCQGRGEDPLSPGGGSPGAGGGRRRQSRRKPNANARGGRRAFPFPGSWGHLSLPLGPQRGEITEEGIGPQREAALRKVMGVYPFLAAEVAETLLARGGRPTRICWTGPARRGRPGVDGAGAGRRLRPGLAGPHPSAPGTGEGLRNPSGALPDFWERPDGTVIRWNSWGRWNPGCGAAWPKPGGGRRPIFSGAWRGRGRTSRGENAPLRAVVNGRLMSVPEDWYDPFLRREIAARPAEFSAAQVVGTVLGKYQLGIGDGGTDLSAGGHGQGENSSR